MASDSDSRREITPIATAAVSFKFYLCLYYSMLLAIPSPPSFTFALQTDILFEGKSLTPDILLVTTSVYDGLVLRGSSLSSLLA